MNQEDDLNRELEISRVQSSLRDGVRQLEDEAFLRKYKDQVDKNIPLAEQFLLQFADQYFKPFTEEENNPLLSLLDITEPGEIEFFKLINDAFKLAKVNKLHNVIETDGVSGYEAATDTRNFQTNMMFLGINGEVGSNPLLDLAENLKVAFDSIEMNTAAQEMDDPPGLLKFVISREGKVYTPQAPRDLVSSYGTAVDEQAEPIEPTFAHAEGAEETNHLFSFHLMIGWDLEHSLPVFISAFGTEGLAGQSHDLRFSFQSSEEGTNQFPSVPKETVPVEISYTADGNEVNCRFVGQYDNREYEISQEFKKVGVVKSNDGRELIIWGNNAKWNSLTYRESEN